ncbi:unnamed protein product [Ceutorhynchus assimilis]|uniref:Uncharacterized protein n=1 Tax=Ceutorhynchus assimilis TaxID=467358 RepID=A0A9P0DDV9_9CUCU|nr:unnamed protein product [Ceutorhynchus assimilis]
MMATTMVIKTALFTILLFYMCSTSAEAGPAAAGVCYAGCAAVTVACFAAAGFTFGTVPGAVIAATPALAACNAAFGVCEAACMAALFMPTP